MIVAWQEVPGKAPPRKDRPVGYGVSASRRPDPWRRELPLGLTTPDHTVPYGTVLWRGAFPGTSCQATIAPSLRDISQQAQAGPIPEGQ
jgi:hypothetical protein